MAAKSTAAGSAAWISAEKENVLQLLQQEKEELVYPAQHEMEWLNEHMAEIFSKSHMYAQSQQLGHFSLTGLVILRMFSKLLGR